MSSHISDVCRSSFLSLRRIGCIRPYLSDRATSCLVNSIVTSCLDFCNSSLTGITADQLNRLQRIQNCAARLIMKKRKYDHITPVIYELHWLPLEFRIQYKLAVLAFRHFEGTLPTYLSAMLCTYEPARSLRSSTERLLKSPRVNLKSAGERSFHFAAPAVWNSLPNSLPKTHSFHTLIPPNTHPRPPQHTQTQLLHSNLINTSTHVLTHPLPSASLPHPTHKMATIKTCWFFTNTVSSIHSVYAFE